MCSRSNVPNDAWHTSATATVTKQQAGTVSLFTDAFGVRALADHSTQKRKRRQDVALRDAFEDQAQLTVKPQRHIESSLLNVA